VKILKIGALVFVVLVAGLLAFAATKPDVFRVERSASIQAPPERIQAILSDFRGWQAWSPWEKVDPGMKRTYSGAASGKGAVYGWEGNRDVGQGRMEITDAEPSRVAMNLDFVKPFEAHNNVEFLLAPKPGATDVTWKMQGHIPYVAKIVHVFVNMDAMVGGQFETGLTNLKRVAEAKP
jgi:hypothetical protein